MSGYWFSMLGLDLIAPIVMIIIGRILKKSGRSMRSKLAFRTKMAKKNRNTWKYAHNFCGNFLLNMGGILIISSLYMLLLICEKDPSDIAVIAKTTCLLQSVSILIPFGFTELALRIKFDSNGNG